MNKKRMFWIVLFGLSAALVLPPVKTIAQQRRGISFEIQKIVASFARTGKTETVVTGLSGLSSAVAAAKWEKIQVIYDSEPEWADNVEMRYYVLLKSKRGRRKQPTMLTGSVTYVNVPQGKNHIAVVYIHPRTVQRYGDTEKIAAQIWYQGVLVDTATWPRSTKTQWWTQIAGVEGQLRTRFFTPFFIDDQGEENIKITPK